jgi:hypothetical protein
MLLAQRHYLTFRARRMFPRQPKPTTLLAGRTSHPIHRGSIWSACCKNSKAASISFQIPGRLSTRLAKGDNHPLPPKKRGPGLLHGDLSGRRPPCSVALSPDLHKRLPLPIICRGPPTLHTSSEPSCPSDNATGPSVPCGCRMDLICWDLFSHVIAVWMGAMAVDRPAAAGVRLRADGEGRRVHVSTAAT